MIIFDMKDALAYTTTQTEITRGRGRVRKGWDGARGGRKAVGGVGGFDGGSEGRGGGMSCIAVVV